ncbi:M3 family oligoendopeptidase [Candidatus Saccharibacteria bacterium]|nr:M3 family oligoendopeptidase [Candidatus Saccharibacteria bacterium]
MNKPVSRFKHYPNRPTKLTSGFAKKEYGKLLRNLKAAELSADPTLWIELYGRWNELKSYVGSEASRISYRYSQNMGLKKSEDDEQYVREILAPAVEEPEHILTKAFLDSKHLQAVADKFGRRLISIYEADLKPSDPVNTKQRIAAGKLAKKYEKTVASAQITVQGEKMTLWKSRSYYESPDESIRKEAFLANRGWFLDHHDELSSIYDQLVQLRHKMAQNVGHENFIPYAYEALGRTDYGPSQVRNFRENVKKYVVPLNRQLVSQISQSLGKTILKPWDGYDPRTSLPLEITPVKSQLNKSQILFNKLSPKLGKYFEIMRENGLIDLENRPGKRSGAFCTDFSDEQKVLIFCNSTGESDDISTLTHEMGHAFQGWESQHIEAVDLQWGTLDLCEIHSTGMEFLCLPFISEFLNEENTQKFQLSRWEQAISTLCYVSVVDEFQHWVYEKPQSTIAERDEKWCSISQEYFPQADYSGYEQYRKTRWYGQSHIFVSPFYYIDYALAETCAIQLALMASIDHQAALRTYMKLCRIGGTKGFLEAVKYGGLRSPFEPELMKDLMKFATKQASL